MSMDPTPAPVVEKEEVPVQCTTEESQLRFEICKPCENFFIDEDQHTKCRGCGCNISMLVTYKNKVCPKGNW